MKATEYLKISLRGGMVVVVAVVVAVVVVVGVGVGRIGGSDKRWDEERWRKMELQLGVMRTDGRMDTLLLISNITHA